jgi:undecaprenyl-diphosphatase
MADLNRASFEFLFRWTGQSPLFDALIVFLAKFLPYLLVLGFLVWVFSRSEWKLRWLVFANGAMAAILSRGIVTETIRFFYHNPRPSDALGFAPLISESSSSFPSGHAAFFLALAVVIFYYSRRIGWWFFSFALAVGVARIMAGVHWPLDILGGIGVGILSGVLAHKLLEAQSKYLIKE